MRLGPLVRVKEIEPIVGFQVRIQFSNGTQRTVDLGPYLHGPIFEPMRRDMTLFRAMKIEGGAITWDNGADIDPDVLYYGLTPVWMEQEARQSVRAAVMQGVTLSQVRESDGPQYDVSPGTNTEAG